MKMDEKISKLENYLLEHPDDTETWLVLSDALQEKGDIRGDIISIEEKIKTLESELKILADKQDEQIKSLFNEVCSYTMRKGYVDTINVSPNDISPDLLEKILTHPYCVNLQRLSLQIDKKTIMKVIHLVNPISLNLSAAYLKDDDLKYLSTLDNFQSLKSITIDSNRFTDKGMEYLSKSNLINKVKVLSVNYNDLTDKSIEVITECFLNLTGLFIRCRQISNKGYYHIASSKSLSSLKVLSLPWNINSENRSALMDSPFLSEDVKKLL